MSTSRSVFASHQMKTSNYMRKHLSAFHRPQKKLIHIPLHTSTGSRRSNYNNLKSHYLLKTREENLKSLSMFGMQVEEAKTKLCTCTNFQSNFWKNKWRLQIHGGAGAAGVRAPGAGVLRVFGLSAIFFWSAERETETVASGWTTKIKIFFKLFSLLSRKIVQKCYHEVKKKILK